MAGRPKEGHFGIEDDVHRYMTKDLAEAPLALKGLHKVPFLQKGQNARRNASTQVDAAGCQHLKRQVTCLYPQDRDEGVQRGDTQLVWVISLSAP